MEGEERSYSTVREFHRGTTESHAVLPLTCTTSTSHGVSARANPPPHYMIKIEGFSILSRVVEEDVTYHKYSSTTFQVGGYKWRLDLFPKGDTERNTNANGYLSLYLVAVETNKLPIDWEVYVDLKFFLYDQIRDEYHIVQDGEGKLSRFNQMKTENGFSRLIAEASFNKVCNGYLVDDTCSFGVEVFVIRNNTRKAESFSAIKCCRNDDHYTWKVSNFSEIIDVDRYESDIFSAAGKQWTIYMKKPTGKNLAFYLHLITGSHFLNLNPLSLFTKSTTFTQEGDFSVYCNFRIRDQVNGNQHRGKKVRGWFRVKSNKTVPDLETLILPLDLLKDPSQGLLLNDTLVIEVTFFRVREVKNQTVAHTDGATNSIQWKAMKLYD